MQKNLILIVLLAIASCSEKSDVIPPPVLPDMQYTDLKEKEVKRGKSQGIDIDKNGSIDFGFMVYHIGDPLSMQDKIRFNAGSNVACNLLVDPNNNSPVLSQNSIISYDNTPPYEWFEVSEVFLGEKIIGVNQPVYWQGPWKDVSHKFLAVQIVKNDLKYNGWIELTFDTANERLILHRAAISTEAGKEVKAGL